MVLDVEVMVDDNVEELVDVVVLVTVDVADELVVDVDVVDDNDVDRVVLKMVVVVVDDDVEIDVSVEVVDVVLVSVKGVEVTVVCKVEVKVKLTTQ